MLFDSFDFLRQPIEFDHREYLVFYSIFVNVHM